MDLSTANLCDGVPVFRGTLYSCSDFLLDLAKGQTIVDISKNKHVNKANLRKFLEEMSIWFLDSRNFNESEAKSRN